MEPVRNAGNQSFFKTKSRQLLALRKSFQCHDSEKLGRAQTPSAEASISVGTGFRFHIFGPSLLVMNKRSNFEGV
jgi:hypothetical protein